MSRWPDDDQRRWAEVRGRLSVGQRLRGVVIKVPLPLGIGVFVDLGLPVGGFVDRLWLPWDTARWPTTGTVTDFEIVLLDDRPQVRVRPLDWRYLREDQLEWEQAKARWPVGSVVTGPVVAYNSGDRAYRIELGQFRGYVWPGDTGLRPAVGTSGTFRVVGHFDMLRQLDLVPVTDPDADEVPTSTGTG